MSNLASKEDNLSYTKWWYSLLISFSVATWGLVVPLYARIPDGFGTANGGTWAAILLVALTYQALPMTVLFLTDQVVLRQWGAARALRIYRTAVFTWVFLFFLRYIQLNNFLQLASLPTALKVGLIVGILAALIGFVIYVYRPITVLFVYLSAASAILTGVFAYQTGLFGNAWSSPSVEASSSIDTPRIDSPAIFIVVFDAFSQTALFKDGQINPGIFPNFAALAQESVVFTNATSNYYMSRRSIPSLMTGLWDSSHQCRGISGSCHDDLLAILSDAGYTAHVFEEYYYYRCSGENLNCWDQTYLLKEQPQLLVAKAGALLVEHVYPQFLRKRIDRISPLPLLRTSYTYSRGMWDEFVAAINASADAGHVYYVHVILPHGPYLDRNGKAPVQPNSRDDMQIERAYEEQIMFLDKLFGRFVDKLKAENMYDSAIIAMTSDHGNRQLGQLRSNLPEELNDLIPRVPFIIHGPGIAPQVSSVDYQHIDFVPTLLDILDIPIAKELPGVSAFAPERSARDKVFYRPGATYVYDTFTGRWLLSENVTP